MSENDGLYIGAALLGLGGVFLLSQSEDGISGGGLGETIREQIESVVAVPQVISKTKSILTEVIDNTKQAVGDVVPTNEEIVTASGNAGSTIGQTIGGAISSAFLNGVTDMYMTAIATGANFAGRKDVTPENAWDKFKVTGGGLLNNIGSGLYNGAGILAKGIVMGGDAGDAARYLSNSSNNSNNAASGLITGVVKASTSRNSTNRSSGGGNGSAKITAFNRSALSRKAAENTAGIHTIVRHLKVEAGA